MWGRVLRREEPEEQLSLGKQSPAGLCWPELSVSLSNHASAGGGVRPGWSCGFGFGAGWSLCAVPDIAALTAQGGELGMVPSSPKP